MKLQLALSLLSLLTLQLYLPHLLPLLQSVSLLASSLDRQPQYASYYTVLLYFSRYHTVRLFFVFVYVLFV